MTGERLETFQREFNQRRVYLKKLPPNITDRELQAFFFQYGHVERAYKANNQDKQGSYFGFVLFSDQLVAQKLIGSFVTIECHTVEVKAVTRGTEQLINSNQAPKNVKSNPEN